MKNYKYKKADLEFINDGDFILVRMIIRINEQQILIQNMLSHYVPVDVLLEEMYRKLLVEVIKYIKASH